MIRIELNRRGVAELLKSERVAAELQRRAQAVANAAGPGHKVDVTTTGTRARAAVVTDTVEAMLNETTDRNLSRSFNAASG